MLQVAWPTYTCSSTTYLRQINNKEKWREVDLNPNLYSKSAASYKLHVGGTLPAQYGKRHHQAERRAALWAYEGQAGPSGTYSQPVQVQNTLPRHRTHLQEKYSTDTIREGDSAVQDRETTWVHSSSDLSCHAGLCHPISPSPLVSSSLASKLGKTLVKCQFSNFWQLWGPRP
jgi:hypothetical protein